MLKSELSADLAATMTHVPEALIKASVDHLLATMTAALQSGQRIEIRGFGAFARHAMNSRQVHNPATGEKIMTAGTQKIHFKPGKALRNRVNQAKLSENMSDLSLLNTNSI